MSARDLPNPSLRRGAPAGSGFELYSWLFMRVSGIVLLGLAVFHLFWMHVVIGVDNIDFNVVVDRWRNPLWRFYDLMLLVFALTHGMNGLRTVADDYVHRPARRLAVKVSLAVAYLLFLMLGAYIILSFEFPPLVAVRP